MSNFFVSYDLNGQHPTHAEMDKHIKELGGCVARVLETVWYVRYSSGVQELYNYVNRICSENDRVLVISADGRWHRNLLPGSSEVFDRCWNK